MYADGEMGSRFRFSQTHGVDWCGSCFERLQLLGFRRLVFEAAPGCFWSPFCQAPRHPIGLYFTVVYGFHHVNLKSDSLGIVVDANRRAVFPTLCPLVFDIKALCLSLNCSCVQWGERGDFDRRRERICERGLWNSIGVKEVQKQNIFHETEEETQIIGHNDNYWM